MEPSSCVPGSSPVYTITLDQTLPDNQCVQVVQQLWPKLVLFLSSSKVPDVGPLLPLNAIFVKIPLCFTHSSFLGPLTMSELEQFSTLSPTTPQQIMYIPSSPSLTFISFQQQKKNPFFCIAF